jgi:lysophospholipase L1-like esterase
MKKGILLVLIMISVVAFTLQKKTRVIFFGDSITELGVKPGGYVNRVDSMCKVEGKGSSFEFTGSGISGNKVYDLYLRMEEDVLAKNPDVVVIYVGVNDVWHKTLLGTGTDPDKFEKFYLAILKKLKEKNIKAVLCTPAVVGEKTDMSNPLDGDINRYSNMIRDIAKKNELPLIDLRKKFLDYELANNPENKEKDILTYDRVHMNAKGNQFLADAMWSTIRSLN